jgi:amidophosphoribosyltransferase
MTYDFDMDGDTLREECGVFGIFGHPDAAALTALGLHALQHRGQEAAGIVTYDNGRFHYERRMGLVGDHFSSEKVINRLKGSQALGHVRYSTTGETILRNVQPLFAELAAGGIATAHNGNLTNGLTLRKDLIAQGAIYQSTSDTEAILHLVARSKKTRLIERYIDALRNLEGAYALVSLTNKKLIGARDPLGIRPLMHIFSVQKHVRSISLAQNLFAKLRMAKSLLFPKLELNRCTLSHAKNRAPVYLSISISRALIQFWAAAQFMMCAKPLANSWHWNRLALQM